MKFVSLIALGLLLTFSSQAADTITLTDETVVTGYFEKFNAGMIILKDENGKQVKYPLMKLSSLKMDPPATVNVKPRSKKKIENIDLLAYEKPKFIFNDNGKTIELSGMDLSYIEVGMDFKRAMQIKSEEKKETADAIDVDKLVKKGAVTVFHFYCPELRALQQPDNYIVRLHDEKKIHLVQVNIGAWDSEVAIKYDIKSLPQFWIYDRKGQQFTKLVERFTASDIDSAINAARRK